MSTGHMMSQLSKTIKLALKSTEDERAILRARSAVQRFPVVEWRQRMEDFHKRSIHASRGLAGHDAWRPSDGATGGLTAIAEHDDWNPVHQADPSQPDWDAQSAQNSPRTNIPGSPGQWSQETLTPGGDPFLHAPPRIQDGNRVSIISNASDTEGDYSSSQNRGDNGQPEFGSFLDKANRTIAKDQKHAPDPFLETPSRPFGAHSRVSSVESIASIVDEKANSPLNKAIASVSQACFALLSVAYSFCSLPMQTGALLRSSLRSCKTYLQITRKESCPSRNSSQRARKPSLTRFGKTSSPVQQVIDRHGASRFGERLHPPFTITHQGQYVRLFRPTCVNPLITFAAPNTQSFNTTDYDGPLAHDQGEVVVMTGLQIAMSREVGGWPLYTIVMALGQVLSATSFQITLLSGQSSQDNLQLYVLGGVFLAASAVWYPMFRLKPSFWVLSAPWLFFGFAFFIIGLPSLTAALHPTQKTLASVATWCYAVASAAAFIFFGLNFGEEAVGSFPCIVTVVLC
jgi:alpha-1,3-glucan synthase